MEMKQPAWYLLAWRVQGPGKDKLFYQNSAKPLFRSFTRPQLHVLVSVEVGHITLLSGSRFSSNVGHVTQRCSSSHFSLLAMCSFACFIFPGKFSDMKTVTHEDLTTNKIEVIIWLGANSLSFHSLCAHIWTATGKTERESEGQVIPADWVFPWRVLHHLTHTREERWHKGDLCKSYQGGSMVLTSFWVVEAVSWAQVLYPSLFMLFACDFAVLPVKE